MARKKILLLTDNEELLNRFIHLIKIKNIELRKFDFAFSSSNKSFTKKFNSSKWIKPIKIENCIDELISNYTIIISLHCKQIFPARLINNIKCINVHPGFSPFNRGWFPQVFSIMNGLPCGA